VSFKDRAKRVADDAIAKATSDEVREKATALSTTAQKAAHDIAESDIGRKVIGTAKDAANEVLDNLAGGDSVSQAAAKTARTQVKSRTPSSGDGPEAPATATGADQDE
jgi:hypothetical protein